MEICCFLILPAEQSTFVPESCQLLVLLSVEVPSDHKAHGHQDVHPVLASKCYKVNHGSYRERHNSVVQLCFTCAVAVTHHMLKTDRIITDRVIAVAALQCTFGNQSQVRTNS